MVEIISFQDIHSLSVESSADSPRNVPKEVEVEVLWFSPVKRM